jgi:hypothetical protein
VVLLDAPMHLDKGWLANGINNSIPAGGHLRLVSLDVRFGWPDAMWSKLVTAAPKDWRLTRIKMVGEDHETMVFSGFFQGLKEVFSDYSAVQVKGLSGQDAFAHYVALEPQYGGACTPPLFVLERAVRDLAFLGKAELARNALKAWANGYGEFDERAELAAMIDECEQALKGKETVEQLFATKPPTPAQMAPYLGVWKGYGWVSVDENRKSPITVTFGIEDGHGVAKIVNEDAPEQYRNEKATFLRVTPGGIEFGMLNGMMPRGIFTRVGRIVGNKLEGESVIKGAYAPKTKQEQSVKHLFTLTKVG